VTVTLTRETVLEALEVGYRKRVHAVRSRRRLAHRKKLIAERWRAAIEWRLREASLPVWVKDDPELHQHSPFMKVIRGVWPWARGHPHYAHAFGSSHRLQPHGMHLNLEALSHVQLETAALETGVALCRLLPVGFKMPEPRHQVDMSAAQVEGADSATGSNTSRPQFVPTQPLCLPLTHARVGRMAVMLGTFAFAVTERSFANVAGAASESPQKGTAEEKIGDSQSPLIRHDSWSIAEQYESMRTGIEVEEKRAFATRLFVVCFFFMAFWLVCISLRDRTSSLNANFLRRLDLGFSL
jgi:potassium channel subfamily K